MTTEIEAPTSIEWAANPDGSEGETWNPVRGCDKVSPGCKHCYAETFAERWRGIPGHAYEQGFDLRLAPSALDKPLRWKNPKSIFVNSMSDLFHEGVSDDYIAAVFGVMAVCERHRFIVLTKRAERMVEWFARIGAVSCKPQSWMHEAVKGVMGYENPRRPAVNTPDWPLRNVMVGVSVEDRRYGVPRIDHLRRVPAAVRVLSIEPLLEDLGELDLRGIGWVLIGGESGAGARPFHLEWARSIVEQCRATGVPCFFKQAGARPVEGSSMLAGSDHPDSDLLLHPLRLKNRKGGDLSELPGDWPREFPEVPRAR